MNNILQSDKDQAITSATAFQTIANTISNEINISKDTQTTVSGNTNAQNSIEASKQTAGKISKTIQNMSSNIHSVAEEFQAMDDTLRTQLESINSLRKIPN
ncbi:TIGR04197 family type VII secretion effector, partial [Gemella cuniculi]